MESDRRSIAEYTHSFKERVFALGKLRLADMPKDAERVNHVNIMIEEHYRIVGEMPKPYLLSKLADYLLSSELKSRDVDKVTNNEFPILSEYQQIRRERSQVSMETDNMDFLDTKFNKGLDSLAKTTVKKAEY